MKTDWKEEVAADETMRFESYSSLLASLQKRMARAGKGRAALARSLAAALLLAAALPLAALRGRGAALRTWLRLCTQVGHLHALRGGDVVAYGGRGPAPRPRGKT